MKQSEERKRLVLLGTGFAAVTMLKHINLAHYTVTVISPRNHFLFTPLLPSTTVGTVEFRSIIEPIRKTRKGIDYVQANCTGIDADARTVACRSTEANVEFTIPYDTLVIAVGAWNNTFGVPGVAEHAFFLKELADARGIREKIVSCLERADVPGIDPKERERLLHFVIVGGGPTGVEFAAELHDLVQRDLSRSYPDLKDEIRITLYEAQPTLLNSFDTDLRGYTMQHFSRQGIELQMGTKVREVKDGRLVLADGAEVPAGLIVWSTGYAPTGLVAALPFAKDRGQLLTDAYARIPERPEMYALGDCANVIGTPLPQTAQVACSRGSTWPGH